ncbi:GH36-type glycosyl hydrolase domain-containing protein [Acidovorax sp. SRB_14]|uniref:GH36-type glycosyl hydrolase domain-containing protein n=1 Tax=Acidovorax sp. SRB_14 TaxID=1962699 RepID=UPI001567C4C6|nr:hypothetical protein [Acidovorax sp. SRB_14]
MVAFHTARSFHTAPLPEVQLLSNGRYHAVVSRAGGGYSHWKGVALTRWREDATCDPWGSFCYLRDRTSGHIWSATLQPTLQQADVSEATFSVGQATFRRRDHGIEVETEIAVAGDDDVEVRRIRITNHSRQQRLLDVTSYAEVVLATAAADVAHPAFEKLFVETEILPASRAIVCTRRARAPGEATPCLFHLLALSRPSAAAVSYETDRARFIGRGRSTADPQALDNHAPLSGSAGAVLDPVVAIRCPIFLGPGASTTIAWVSGVADTRDACASLVQRYQDQRMADHALASAPTHAQALLDGLHVSAADARRYAALAAAVLYANAVLRARPAVLSSNRQGQSSLWRYGISGDWPIVLLQICDPGHLELVRQLVQAHAYWRMSGLRVDLVVLAENPQLESSDLAQQVVALVAAEDAAAAIDRPGGIFVRASAALPEADAVLLKTVARIVLDGRGGALAQQLAQRLPRSPVPQSTHHFPTLKPPLSQPQDAASEQALIFPNGLGGFTADGNEYVVTLTPERMAPMPWINILANPFFGSFVSESGSAHTWSENAQTFRLTPWSNDPVIDPNTEAFYLRDEDSGHYWSPTVLPSPIPGASYVARHGFGYSVFEHSQGDIHSELTVFVAQDAPVKFARLQLCNRSEHERRLSVTGYVEWVLGEERTKTAMHIGTERDADSGALLACNPYHTDFTGRTAFFDVDGAADAAASACGDRRAFLGMHGNLRRPAAMQQLRLCGSVGVALDPCAALRVPFVLAPGQTHEIIFRLGAGATPEEARSLVQRWRGPASAHAALDSVRQYWRHTLGAVQIQTPDRALDLLANGWLLYQTLACRLWARTAFYQASGAFGFRDQLQDAMALVHATPARVRAHLLLCASRQFPEGDVQHWWHPPSGRGVRTRCSDDYLWLPLAVCRYVAVTGDMGVLTEQVAFLEGRALQEHEGSYYDLPTRSETTASLYRHCMCALEHGLRFGAHGLPLMGTGDWNDGMNLVGAEGKGESVWLGFFLCQVLAQFAALARRHGDAAFAQRCQAEAAQLRGAIEHSAWDGVWYQRGWFDDGSPLGTAGNAECRIDSIAQSWAVLSGAADAQRARQAMDAVDAQLVHRGAALVQLLDPPFNHSAPSPGYIQGYVPGVRENGGQYTHAAVWAGMAFAALGDAKRAWELCTMLNPLHHADSPQALAVYQTEPYVIASDVYALPPHTGRGGWTWYTGSAGWMWRFILESLLGLRVESDTLRIVPCLPAHWGAFQVNYRYRATLYLIEVRQTPKLQTGPAVILDGAELPGPAVPLVDDGREHAVVVQVHTTGDSQCKSA